MSTNKRSKKSQSLEDWHPADIVAALRKCGWSLRALSLHHNLGAGTLKNAMHKPYPKAEKQIANAIGVSAWEIWPSRYDVSADGIGVPNRPLGRRPVKAYDTAPKKTCNVKKRKAA